MTTTRRTTVRPKPEQDVPKPGDACETNIGQPTKGKRKPQCPDGYPNEQPDQKPTEKK
jgi:hypothetical protein